MIQVSNFTVKSFDIDHLDLSWGITPTRDDLGEYEVTIERSESPGGPWDRIAGPCQDIFSFRDVRTCSFNIFRKYYYKLTYRHRPTDQIIIAGPEWVRADPSLEALEISKLFSLVLRETIGRKAWLFKRRTSGQLCSCTDPILGRKTIGNCRTCYSSSFVGGYLAPIEIYIQIDPAPLTPQLLEVAETSQQNTAARLSSFPPISPRDIIIEAENIRWRVAQIVTTERLRATVRQELQLHRIPTSSIEYSIPLNLDVVTVAPSPEREFTNPATL